MLLAVFLHKSHIWENFCSWDIGQNALSQSYCRIFLNQLLLHNEWMRQHNVLHVDTNSQKLKVDRKFFDVHGQKWAWPVSSLGSEIYYISRMNRFNNSPLRVYIYCTLILTEPPMTPTEPQWPPSPSLNPTEPHWPSNDLH